MPTRKIHIRAGYVSALGFFIAASALAQPAPPPREPSWTPQWTVAAGVDRTRLRRFALAAAQNVGRLGEVVEDQYAFALSALDVRRISLFLFESAADIPDLSSLVDDDTWRDYNTQVSYNASASLLADTLDQGGPERLKGLRRVPSSEFEARFQQIYGRSLDDAERDWRVFCAAYRP